MAGDPVLFSAREAAAILGVHVRTVQLWVRKGRMVPTRTVGNTHVFTGDEIARLARTPKPKLGRPPVAHSQPDQLPLEDDDAAPDDDAGAALEDDDPPPLPLEDNAPGGVLGDALDDDDDRPAQLEAAS